MTTSHAGSATGTALDSLAPATRSRPVLTLAGAQRCLAAALARAEDLGVAVDVAVTDDAGRLLSFARMDGAFAASAELALDKARTVAGFGGLSTGALGAAIGGEPDVRLGIAARAGVAAFPGGVPVLVDGSLAGAVGVSGGSAEQDEDVARAGASAVC
ncbi:heme-binding protein [Nocardioides sp. GY 10127]|uniref:GlcG/HbpS family heme-binding protein n=1 Tax=Nocardioides sp. GY 10127 TaxID=2569762 RepID=UPI0010A7EC51|nr:heme-binding protein [Nocardioides sp. GY 10127]TIC79991.1 heme-binding protein [Nocardioides sp. GY 10127]